MNRKIVIAGGAGYLGRHLSGWWRGQGCRVSTLTRHPSQAEDILWDGRSKGDWMRALDGADVLVNLAGRSVNCRYHRHNREQILNSRVESTRILGKALADLRHPPGVWLNSSSATIYRHAEDRPMDEATGEIGHGFSVSVCRAWEQEFFAACPSVPVRHVALRSAMVMGPGKGGVFDAFHRIVRLGLGGTLGNGKQFVSWIHLLDWMRAVDFLATDPQASGAFNLAAPNPLPNREFLRILRSASGVPFGMPATEWMLEIGAFFLRTETELLLKSRRVIPGRLTATDFQFLYPDFSTAAEEICANTSLANRR